MTSDGTPLAELADVLTRVPDMSRVLAAVLRESAVRTVMDETNETREVAEALVDSLTSMEHEAVLELTEGRPTTLRDGLERLVEGHWRPRAECEDGCEPQLVSMSDVYGALRALLDYPWQSGITVEHPDDETVEVRVHGGVVIIVNHDEHGYAGMTAVQRTAESIARALDSVGTPSSDGDDEEEYDYDDVPPNAGSAS